MARTAEKAPATRSPAAGAGAVNPGRRFSERGAGKPPGAKNTKRALEELSRRGPNDVLRGDLSLAGLPGLVCTPRSGLGLPAVAFGHGWLQPPARYRDLLAHLASWGIVAAAPGTHRGLLPSHRLFAHDLRTTLDIVTRVRLGDGRISIDANRLALAGHAMGGACAVLASAGDDRVRAVASFALAETQPPALNVAQRCTMPGLHVAAGQDRLAPAVAHAEPVARAWGGPVQLRTVTKASHLGFTEGRHWSELLLDGRAEHGTRRLARGLLTAFLLRALAGDRRGDALLDGDAKGCPIEGSRS